MKATLLLKLIMLAGVVLVAAAALVPATALVVFLRGEGAAGNSQLIVGATGFKISLLLVGLAIIVMTGLPIWHLPIQSKNRAASSRTRVSIAILLVILLVATLLRLYQLNNGLWLDEIVTEVLFAKAPFGSIITSFDSENQHFLYSLLAHISLQWFGDTAWALRLPAVLFGVGSIGAIYLLGSEAATGREGLLSAALLTFSYQHIWFSQDARGYSGLLFWTILSTWFFIRAQREAKPQLWLFYASSVALGVYTHITMLFVVAGQFALYFVTFWAQRRQRMPFRAAGFFLGFGFSGLLTLLLYSLVLPQLLEGMGRETSLVAEWKDPFWTALELIKGAEVSFAGGAVAAVALLVFGAGLFSYARTNPEILEMLFVPTFLCAAVVIGLGHHLWPRFFFFELGFGALVVIRGALVVGDLAVRLFKMPPGYSARVGSALCVGLIFFAGLSIRYVYGPKQDYTGALALVRTESQSGDAIVTAGLTAFVYKHFYGMDWQEVGSLSELNAVRAHAKRTWLIYTFEPVLQSEHPEIMETLQREFFPVKRFDGTVSDGTIFVARSDLPPGVAIR